VICWGNSGRSIMAEALFRSIAGAKVEVHSAGIEPQGVHPGALRTLAEAGIAADGLRSKSVDEYLGQTFDFVITVCDDARQACPVFPGVAQSLHWSYQDPAKAEGEAAQAAAFRRVFTDLGSRIHQFLPLAERFAAERRPVELA
jgi:protein-tyrosine-phosphatase